MAYCTVVVLCIAITSLLAAPAPANNDQLDKRKVISWSDPIIAKLDFGDTIIPVGNASYARARATVNDVAVNSVSEEKKTEITIQPSTAPVSTVQITGISTGASAPPAPVDTPAQDNAPFKPQRAGSMFARFIDDIFQIPINVLQNVARLITSPFVSQKKTPEVVATVS